MIRFFNPGKAYLQHKDEIDFEMQRVLESGDLILRKDVETFEENLAKFVGTKYAVGVASGTDAIILSLKALGLERGEQVVTSSYTFRATLEAIVHAGGEPVLVDLGDSLVEKAKEIGARFIVPCHLEGKVVHEDYTGFIVVEDMCQAIGAKTPVGHTACYSFYPAKILGCFGDAGAIVMDDEAIYRKVKLLRNHFKDDWSGIGYNSRLDNLQAAVLNVKLKYLPKVLEKRSAIAVHYVKNLEHLDIELPKLGEDRVWQDFIIKVKNRDGLYNFLKDNGIETMKNGYPFPDKYPKLPKTIDYETNSLRLPCNETLEGDEQVYIIQKIKEYEK